jgi:hypothetical protein
LLVIGWTQEPIKSFASTGNQTLSIQPVATPTELSWPPWFWRFLVKMAIICRTNRHWDNYVSSPGGSVTLSAVWPARSMWMRNILWLIDPLLGNEPANTFRWR